MLLMVHYGQVIGSSRLPVQSGRTTAGLKSPIWSSPYTFTGWEAAPCHEKLSDRCNCPVSIVLHEEFIVSTADIKDKLVDRTSDEHCSRNKKGASTATACADLFIRFVTARTAEQCHQIHPPSLGRTKIPVALVVTVVAFPASIAGRYWNRTYSI